MGKPDAILAGLPPPVSSPSTGTGKYDDILAGLPPPVSSPSIGTGKYDDILAGLPKAENENKPSAFKRFGKALPIVGSTIGGILGTAAGPAGSVGGAALGGAAGEAWRQNLGRVLGEDSPMTSKEAAKDIGVEGATSAAGQLFGMGLGKAASAGFKAFPKVAHAFSGTPAVNIARAQQRGFKVFSPGISREAAGKAQAAVEHPLIEKLFSPTERVLIRSKDAKFADNLVKSVMLKQERGLPITAKEAIGIRIMAPVKRAADTSRGISKNIEIDKAVTGARATIAENFPELTKRLSDTEKAITASQLRKFIPVNKTNPDQISKLGTLLSVLSGSASLPFSSPLSMGIAGATMGQVKKSIPATARTAIQRGSIQSLARVLGEQ